MPRKISGYKFAPHNLARIPQVVPLLQQRLSMSEITERTGVAPSIVYRINECLRLGIIEEILSPKPEQYCICNRPLSENGICRACERKFLSREYRSKETQIHKWFRIRPHILSPKSHNPNSN